MALAEQRIGLAHLALQPGTGEQAALVAEVEPGMIQGGGKGTGRGHGDNFLSDINVFFKSLYTMPRPDDLIGLFAPCLSGKPLVNFKQTPALRIDFALLSMLSSIGYRF